MQKTVACSQNRSLSAPEKLSIYYIMVSGPITDMKTDKQTIIYVDFTTCHPNSRMNLKNKCFVSKIHR